MDNSESKLQTLFSQLSVFDYVRLLPQVSNIRVIIVQKCFNLFTVVLDGMPKFKNCQVNFFETLLINASVMASFMTELILKNH